MSVRSSATFASALLLIASLVTPGDAIAAESPAIHVRGTITAVSAKTITVATKSGTVVVTLTPKTHFAGVVPGTVDDITAGTYIGTANVPGPGSARALEVVVFPSAMKGTGEGDYPWDLPAGGNRMSTMTNGTVLAPKTSTMTNATVTSVKNGPIKTVSLAYKGGTKTVSIPPGAPVVRIFRASKALVVVGAHVVVFPPITAASNVVIGEKGAIPPM